MEAQKKEASNFCKFLKFLKKGNILKNNKQNKSAKIVQTKTTNESYNILKSLRQHLLKEYENSKLFQAFCKRLWFFG